MNRIPPLNRKYKIQFQSEVEIVKTPCADVHELSISKASGFDEGTVSEYEVHCSYFHNKFLPVPVFSTQKRP